MTLSVIFSRLGFKGGVCERFYAEADALISAAKDLQDDLSSYMKAADPLSALISTVWNNRQWARYFDAPVDGPNGSGVRTRPINRPTQATR